MVGYDECLLIYIVENELEGVMATRRKGTDVVRFNSSYLNAFIYYLCLYSFLTMG
jgi:hypothetical protein